MGFPFQKIDGKPIDLNNQQHRDIVMQRNKKLEYAIENGLCVTKVKINVFVDVEFDCLKCGTSLDERVSIEHGVDIFEFELDSELGGSSVKCKCCETRYVYSSLKELFYVRPVDQLKEQLKAAKR